MATSHVSPDLQNGIISNPHDPTIRSTFRLASLRPTILVPASPRDDHIHVAANQIGCEVGQSLDVPLSPSILDDQVLALDPAELA